MPTAPLRVLIVDDSIDTARMLKILLTQEGFEACLAYSGLAALESARAFRPNAVLLDMTLPDMSGSDVARKLKGVPELGDCVLVAVSGHDIEMIDSPTIFDHYFKKPVDYEALVRLLAGLQSLLASSAQPDDRGGQVIY